MTAVTVCFATDTWVFAAQTLMYVAEKGCGLILLRDV